MEKKLYSLSGQSLDQLTTAFNSSLQQLPIIDHHTDLTPPCKISRLETYQDVQPRSLREKASPIESMEEVQLNYTSPTLSTSLTAAMLSVVPTLEDS